MPNKPNHIIHKVSLDINTDTSEQAFIIKDNISNFLKTEVFPEIERQFQQIEHTSNNFAIRFDTLNLNISTSKVTLDSAFKDEIIQTLKSEITNSLKEHTTNKSSKENIPKFLNKEGHQLETLLHFLEHGMAPWWQNEASLTDLLSNDILTIFLLEPNFKTRLLQILPNTMVQKRLINQLDTETLVTIVSLFISNPKKQVSIQNDIPVLLKQISIQQKKSLLASFLKTIVAKREISEIVLIQEINTEFLKNDFILSENQVISPEKKKANIDVVNIEKTSSEIDNNSTNSENNLDEKKLNLTEDSLSNNDTKETLSIDAYKENKNIDNKTINNKLTNSEQKNETKESLSRNTNKENQNLKNNTANNKLKNDTKETLSHNNNKENQNLKNNTTNNKLKNSKQKNDTKETLSHSNNKENQNFENNATNNEITNSKQKNDTKGTLSHSNNKENQNFESNVTNSEITNSKQKNDTKGTLSHSNNKGNQNLKNNTTNNELKNSKQKNDTKETLNNSNNKEHQNFENNATNNELKNSKQKNSTKETLPHINNKEEQQNLESNATNNELKNSELKNTTTDKEIEPLTKKVEKYETYVYKYAATETALHLNNAGLVLAHPFIPHLFKHCKLIDENNNIIEPELAVHILHYLATGKEQQAESDMLFEKFLCNIPFEQSIDRYITISDAHKEETNKVLNAIKQNWKAMGTSSNGLIQNEFLQRLGKLEFKNSDAVLTIEKKTQDILLKKLSWGISMIRFPWKKGFLYVHWN